MQNSKLPNLNPRRDLIILTAATVKPKMNHSNLISTIVISATLGPPIVAFACWLLCCTNRTWSIRTKYRRERARRNESKRQAHHTLAQRDLENHRAQAEEARAAGETLPENPELEEKARRASKELRDWAEIRALPVSDLFLDSPRGRPIDRWIELMES